MKTYRIIVKNGNKWIAKERGLTSFIAYKRLPYYEDIYGSAKVIREKRDIKQIKDMK